MRPAREVFVSVDIEAAGPIPGEYSLLTIGACDVDNPEHAFSCELKPLNLNAVPKALEVTGLSLARLQETGLLPEEAMTRFEEWVTSLLAPSDTPVLVGLNAAFDWSFVNYYFWRFLGRNPFGYMALDIKAYYMGATGCRWADTRSSQMEKALRPQTTATHQALDDARYQAELFRLIRDRH